MLFLVALVAASEMTKNEAEELLRELEQIDFNLSKKVTEIEDYVERFVFLSKHNKILYIYDRR